jgi:predicted DNA binding CopG/RHH family protein
MLEDKPKPGAPIGNKNAQREAGDPRQSITIRLPVSLIKALKERGSVTGLIESAVKNYLKIEEK